MEEQDIKLVEVFAGQHWQATMIQNILEDHHIQTFLDNELMGTIAPWRVSAGGFNPVRVIVSSANQEASLKIIEAFNQTDEAAENEEE